VLSLAILKLAGQCRKKAVDESDLYCIAVMQCSIRKNASKPSLTAICDVAAWQRERYL